MLICSDLIAAAPLSELLRALFGPDLPTESVYWTALGGAGFDLVFAARATRTDWDLYHLTLTRLRERPPSTPASSTPTPTTST